MGKLIRAIILLILLALIGLVIYAYAGQMFGADFSAPQSERRIPVELHGS
ncbi:hypothetical protein [Pseudopelagicola sp. nBUS_19]